MAVREINKKIEDMYPLSPMQQGMLYHSLYGGQSGLYSELYTFTINGPLNIDHFRTIWDHLVEMHPILRTIFRWRKLDSPVQVVLKERKPSFEIKDLRSTDEEDQKKEIDTFCREIRSTPFDLEKGPLMRVALFLLGKNKVHVVWNYHHILMDGWSMPILIRDLFTTYIALETGQRLPSPTARPYKDYIRWLNKQDKESSMAFWKKQLEDFNEPTPLPVDYYPAKREGFDIGKKVLDLPRELTSRLSALAKDERVTLSSLISTAWAILLSRYSNEDDIVFGYTVSGRPPDLEGSEDMVGLFINTLPLRAKIDETRSFLALLKDVHGKALEIRDYEYSLLTDIKACSSIKGRQSLFDSIVVFENYPSESISIEGDFSISDFTVTEITNFDLTVLVSPGEQMNICIEYARDLFEDSTIERMISHLQNLLENIAANPKAQVCNLTMLSEDEMNQVLIEFNDTDSDFPKDKSPYQLFEEQVDRTPEKTAVTFGDNSLTYRELNEKVNQLAHYLRKKGVGKETMIGLMLERSLDMIIGILGIQKAGGAYIPMDPEYPRPRLEYMLEDTKAPVLVTQSALLERISKRPTNTVVLDTDWDKISLESKDDPSPLSTPENLSHIIYTSGSTGIPKGVMIEHRNVTAFLYWCMEEFFFDEYEEMIASTSICFDLSVFEFFLPLITGAQVIILKSSLDIDDYLKNYTATMINTVPSALKHFLSVTNTRHRIKTINLAGEPLKLDLVQGAYEKLDVDIIRNLYGPTEDTTYSTNFRVPRDSDRQPLIGRPISNTKAYILDKYLNPVPIGVIGEIYLAGAGIARGYLNAPEKTTQRFIPNPFSILEDNYLYRTGDLGRYLPDGNIEFLGRVDYQVKIRGNRIELGEIEARLSTYEGIKDCVVVDKDDKEGDKYLVAYYVSQKDISITDLRSYLKETLPEYMVPSRFVHLESLPLTPNGKIDRKALPEPEGLRPEMESIYVAPRNDIERILVEVWENVLGIDKVGIHDNFFDLGGHSLLIMKVLAKMQLKYPIGVQDFFDYQTVAELTQIISERMEDVDVTRQGDTISEVEAESDEKIDIEISGLKEVPKNILLTGATGYLGSHLLYELLLRTDARIYCLVRGDDEEQIRQKLQDSLDFYFADKEMDYSRIRPVLGNLEQDGLALSEGISKKLSEEIDTIVHTAADVRHFGEYEHFRNINVYGTKRLLKLATSGKCERFHHVSTLSISGNYIPNMDQVVFKETDYDRGQKPDNVYARSKFEAEGIVRDAIKQGLNATIYRVGNLVGDSTTGQFQQSIETNAFYGLLKALLDMRIMPDVSDGLFDLTPIDSCSNAIVELMLLPETARQTLHVYNSYQVGLKDLAGMLQSIGYSIEIISPEDYLNSINKIKADSEKGEVLEKLVPHLAGSPSPKTRIVYDNRVAMHFFKAIGFKWPKVDRNLVDSLIRYCINIGYIEPPIDKEKALPLGDLEK